MYQTENNFEYGDLQRFIDYTEKATKTKLNLAVRKYLELEDQLKKHLQNATDKKVTGCLLSGIKEYPHRTVVETDNFPKWP